jgi:nucleoside-diphosphate-sugar epimerase
VRVLVAGATGSLGAPLTRRLLAIGHEVIGLSRTPADPKRLHSLGAEPLVADAMDRDALLRAVDGLHADAVAHQLTALKKPPVRHGGMAATDALRERGTGNLLAAARVVGARRFVTQSMIFGYGYGDWGDKVLTEDHPFAPPGRGRFEWHIAAMRSAESQTLTAEGIEGIALRYGLLYGPRAGTGEMVEMLRRRRFPIPRDGGGILSWIYVEDAAAATVAALERGRPGRAYNVVDDEPVSWRSFTWALADAFGAPRPWEIPGWMLRPFGPHAAAMLRSTLRASNARARRELNWAPSAPTYRDGIRRMTASVRQGAAPHQRRGHESFI